MHWAVPHKPNREVLLALAYEKAKWYKVDLLHAKWVDALKPAHQQQP